MPDVWGFPSSKFSLNLALDFLPVASQVAGILLRAVTVGNWAKIELGDNPDKIGRD